MARDRPILNVSATLSVENANRKATATRKIDKFFFITDTSL
jgi:hypothetical protein